MLRLDDKKEKITEAFGISEERADTLIDEFMDIARKGHTERKPVSWIIRRIWINENFTDNERVFLIFQFGNWFYKYVISDEDE